MDAAARAGLARTATTGLRWRSNPAAVTPPIPIRSAYFGATFGVLGVVAVLVFASSLNHLDTTPRFSGYTWDFSAVDNGSDTCNANPAASHVRWESPNSPASVSKTSNSTATGQRVGIPPHPRNNLQPSIVKGRAPNNAHEVALGAKTLHALRQDDRRHRALQLPSAGRSGDPNRELPHRG